MPATVVHQVTVDRPAADARLQPAGQLDHGDELVVLVAVGIGPKELGQGEQQFAPPLDSRFESQQLHGCG